MMRNALAVIGALVVAFYLGSAFGWLEFRLYAGADPVGYCERANHGR